MRYLWIEDFNGGDDKDTLKKIWLNHYRLTDKEIVVKENLVDGLKYINENPNEFDAVLLDIRLDGEVSHQIYEDYFKTIVTEEFFNNNIETGTGILIYLYLTMVTGFPKERIAFLSANIKEKKYKKGVEEIIFYRNIGELTDEDIDDINTKVASINENSIVKAKYPNDYKDVNEFFAQFDSADFLLGDKKTESDGITYNRAKVEFAKVGLLLPNTAFEKPDPNASRVNINESRNFEKEFVEVVETDYTIFRRNLISMSHIIFKELKKKPDLLLFNRKSYFNDNKLFNLDYFENMLQELAALPMKRELSNLKQIVWLVTQCMESGSSETPTFFVPHKDQLIKCTKYEKFKEQCKDKLWMDGTYYCKRSNYCFYKYSLFEYASHSMLKFIRNWLAHGKLAEKEFNIEFVKFIVNVSFRFIFDIENFSEESKKEYLRYEAESLECSFDILKTNKDDIKEELKNSCINLYNKNNYTDNIGAVINSIGSPYSKKPCNNKLLYKSFIYSLLPAKFVMNKESKYSFELDINTLYLESKSEEMIRYLTYAYDKVFK